jgi:hypothetical protein
MTHPMFRPAPDSKANLPDAELWESLVDRGLSEQQATVHIALRRHAKLERSTLGPQRDVQEDQPGWLGSTVASVAHGASLGTGEVFSGLADAARGTVDAVRGRESDRSFRSGAQRYRDAMDEIEAAHPTLSAAGQVVGTIALPAATVGQGVKAGMKAGVPLATKTIAQVLTRGAVSAGAPAAVAGFSAGGDDPGDFGARLESAVKSGAIGAILGAGFAATRIPGAQRSVERDADLVDRGVQRQRNAAQLAGEHLRTRNAELRNLLLEQQVGGSPRDATATAPARGATPRIDELDIPTFRRRQIAVGETILRRGENEPTETPLQQSQRAVREAVERRKPVKAPRTKRATAQLPVEEPLPEAASDLTNPQVRVATARVRGRTVRGQPAVTAAEAGVAPQPSPRPGTWAPGGGRYVEPGPTQKAPLPVRVQSARQPSDMAQNQVGLVQDFLRGSTSHADAGDRLKTLRDMGVITQQQLEDLVNALAP